MPEEGNVSTKKTDSSEIFGKSDAKDFDLKTPPQQDAEDFGDSDTQVPRHKFFNRTPNARELQKGVIGISEDSNNVMRLHIVNSKGEVKTTVFT